MPHRRFTAFHVVMLLRNGHFSYWGICTVTQATWVDFCVFHCVRRHVHFEARWIYVSFIAEGAFVGFILVVLAPVGLGKRVKRNVSQYTKKYHTKVQINMWRVPNLKKSIVQTCRFESWVKAFSQPGWLHLYGRSPVWILNYEQNHKHVPSMDISVNCAVI